MTEKQLLDTFDTPQEVYELTQLQLSDAFRLRKFPAATRERLLKGASVPWNRRGDSCTTHWVDGVTTVRIGGRRG